MMGRWMGTAHMATNTRNSAGNRLKQLLQRAGLTVRAAAERAGYAHGSGMQRHTENKSDALDAESAIRIAKALDGLGEPPITFRDAMLTLTGLAVDGDVSTAAYKTPVGGVTVVGRVQAGSWGPAMQSGNKKTVPYAAPDAWSGYQVVAFEISGPSMSRVYPNGSHVVCVSYEDLGREPRPGERVIVQRTRRDGLVEASCKEYRISEKGLRELWPLSDHPDHQKPLAAAGTDVETVQITHRVVSAIVHEPL